MTLRQFIEAAVAAEVAAYRGRQRAKHRFNWLSLPTLEARLAEGNASFGRQPTPPVIDQEVAIQAALDAVSDGVVLVSVDGRPVLDPDLEIPAELQSTVRFIKLVSQRGL
ncbi:MAG: hypothetical protein J0M04_21125 [Verrucomicrobia bacterium]|nr:hypothetical protein [Verrucomicrobiota bacterium]